MSSFDEWFKRTTGNYPFPYQRCFAEAKEIPQLVDVPTGLGKTAMAGLHRRGGGKNGRYNQGKKGSRWLIQQKKM